MQNTSAGQSAAARGLTMGRSQEHDVAIVGGGIVGMAVAMTLLHRRVGSVVVLEAERDIGQHQTGHNSGVIHSGVYYQPGSLKARLCEEGREALYRFCEAEQVPFQRCGKIILATAPAEVPRLDELEQRARANGRASVRRLTPPEIREREPHAGGLAALLVEDTGIVDFGQVLRAMAAVVVRDGGEIRVGVQVRRIVTESDGFVLISDAGDLRCRNLVNCAGLQSDRVARMSGLRPAVRIIPFRGEYMQLRPDRRNLVRHLIYPVPDPELPFLGQHFTRRIGGEVELGPNAVLAFARHGYRRTTISVRDLASMAAFPGFWSMGRRYWRTAVAEFGRSLSIGRTLNAVRRLLPELAADDLLPGPTGVRAQAVGGDGKLLHDFHLVGGDGMLHVLNAPSPAATASLAIGRYVADRAAETFRSTT